VSVWRHHAFLTIPLKLYSGVLKGVRIVNVGWTTEGTERHPELRAVEAATMRDISHDVTECRHKKPMSATRPQIPVNNRPANSTSKATFLFCWRRLFSDQCFRCDLDSDARGA